MGPASSVGLGLVAASTWGGSDFAGGIGARRSPALLVVASGHILTLLVLLAVCLLGHFPIPGTQNLLLGAIGGLEGSLALALFYRALAMGAMGLTAALTGLLTALIPVLFAFWSEGLPKPLAVAGILVGCIAIWFIAYAPMHADTPPMALVMGAISGAGFGIQLVLLKIASNGGVIWALTSSRIGGVLGLILVLFFVWPKDLGSGNWSGVWRMGILAGALDTIGNLGYTVAAHGGRLDVAATVSSLYPGITILLAALLLHERPSRRQSLGMALALASVLLLSL